MQNLDSFIKRIVLYFISLLSSVLRDIHEPLAMFSYALATGTIIILYPSTPLTFITASTYFHLPIDEEEDRDIDNYERKYLTWVAEPSDSPSTRYSNDNHDSTRRFDTTIIREVLANDDLYEILNVPQSTVLDKATLRRAYLSRSKACHPEYVLFRVAWSISSKYCIE